MILLILCAGNNRGACAEETARWQAALAGMPLPAPAPLLNRENVVCVILEAFRSNDLVRAMIVLPGVLNDFYLIHRDQPKLNLRASNVLEAVIALTNATELRATFQAPFLLLHLAEDRLQPRFVIQDPASLRRLESEHHLPHLLYCDAHWGRLQPDLRVSLRRKFRPEAQSTDAWHFERHNLAGWGLSDWEVLVAVSLASATSFRVEKQAILFQARAR